MGLVKVSKELKAHKRWREKMSVRLSAIDEILRDIHDDRVTHDPDSEADTRVLMQVKILRRNDAGKDHTMTVEYDSGKQDCVTICDNLQKGAGKLNLSRKEIQVLHYVVRECHIIASMAQGGDNDSSL